MASRLVQNLHGITMICTPRPFYQAKLKGVFKQILSLNDAKKQALCERINYYNQLNEKFKLDLNYHGPNGEITSRLGVLPLKKTSCAFDAYSLSRYFNDDYLWIKSFGDIERAQPMASITKSRPIKNAPTNVILKLDSNRHFSFYKDAQEYDLKRDLLFYRGGIYQPHRKEFFKKHFSSKYCDLGHVGKPLLENKSWSKNYASKKEQANFKFLLSLEGNDVASNLKWAMSSNSLVFAPRLKFETWFMEGKLKDEIVTVKDNLDDLIEYYLTHPKEAKEKIDLAHRHCEIFLDKKNEFLVGIMVLAKYFYLSCQCDYPKEIRDFFTK